MARLDLLFEFDAPQSFRDLSAPPPPLVAGEHDAWFDRVHVQHSRPSAELARELAAKLQEHEQQQLQDDKENQRPAADWRSIVASRNKQLKLKQEKKTERRSLKEMRATHEPFQAKRQKEKEQQGRRKPLRDVGNRLDARRKREVATSKEKSEMKSLQELLARHNKKFKASHTYEPPQHSVRVVKQWERETKQSYYALSAEERVQANQEIAAWKKRRLADASQ
ncbi:uncharacterized protein IUM83_07698 [Phytophthora cinnamomi]|uniref:uncharacterized protein n=1 Tax=Phytophthora cinnamomi TaxID=4785 RepID=UPI003559AE23|nr:hypothetical protein IUM83_07698 [Phytophthora cinnamomi]